MSKKNMEKKQLDIKCSPGVFQKLSSGKYSHTYVCMYIYELFKCEKLNVVADEEFRDMISQEASGTETYDEIIFTPNDPDVTMESNFDFESPCCSSDAEPKKTLWLEATTKFLISRVKELRPRVGKTASFKNKKHMWKKIAEELCLQGYNFNVQQVEAKFFTLERQYKKTQLHNSKTGRNRQTCPFQR